MLQRARHLVGLAVGLGLAAGAGAKEPPNLETLKTEIRDYVKSGDYDRDIAAVAERAGAWMRERAKRGGAKLAVVFDLDETLMSNWPLIERLSFGDDDAAYAKWFAAAECRPIEPVRAVYNEARKLGFAILFITGRSEVHRAATVRNLQAIGCGDFAVLVCKPAGAKVSTGSYKAAERARLEGAGYAIVANLGDQASDLAGGHAERTFKLPNPFYFTR